jgi:MFS family permease
VSSFGNSANKKEKLSSKAGRVLNSAMAFVIAYMLIIFSFYVVTALMGKIFGFDATVYYYGVKFELGKHKWNRFNVFFIWGFGTLFVFVLGGLFSYLFYRFKEKLFLVNLIFLWGSVISFSFVAAQGILPCLQPGEWVSPFYQNLAVVFAWFFVPVAILYVLGFLFMAFLVFFSIYTSKPFLSLSYSFSKVNKKARKRKYYFETVFLPFFIASIAILTFTYNTYQLMNFIFLNVIYLGTIFLSLIVSFFVININDMKMDEVLRYKNLQKLNTVLFLFLAFLLLFFTVTSRGFHLPF